MRQRAGLVVLVLWMLGSATGRTEVAPSAMGSGDGDKLSVQRSELKFNKGARLAIHLANPPTARLRVSFDTDKGEHREVEWEPTVSSSLTKEVYLPPSRDNSSTTWHITTASEHVSYAQTSGPAAVLVVKFGGLTGDCGAIGGSKMAGEYVAWSSHANPPQSLLKNWPAPELTFACTEILGKIDDERFLAPEVESGTSLARSFGTAPVTVSETLSLLTEVAVARAKTGALRLVKKRFVDPVCSGSGVSLDRLFGAESKESVFERSCGVLQALRLEDVLSSGGALLVAVRSDLLHTILPSIIESRLQQSTQMARSLLSLAMAAIDGEGGGQALLQMTFHAVQEEALRLARSNDKNSSACLVRSSIAVMKRCTRVACVATDVFEMLQHWNAHFAADDVCKGEPFVTDQVLEVSALVLRGLELLQREASIAGERRVKAAMGVVSKLLALAANDAGVHGELQRLAEIAGALVEEDYSTALSRLLRWASQRTQGSEALEKTTKLVHLIGVVAAYTQTVHDTKDAEPEAARKARKHALEALLDSATDREGRHNEWIASIGSNVGGTILLSRGELGLRAPLGLVFERLPPPERLFGYRVGAQVVDLGQFVRRDPGGKLEDVQWQDFVSVGGEVGLLVGPSVNVSLHLTYAPSLSQGMDEKSGVWRFGLALGYYVPFFDLN